MQYTYSKRENHLLRVGGAAYGDVADYHAFLHP